MCKSLHLLCYAFECVCATFWQRLVTMRTFETNGDQGIELQNSSVYSRPSDCLLTGKLQNQTSPKEPKRRGNILNRQCKSTTNEQKISHWRATSSGLWHRTHESFPIFCHPVYKLAQHCNYKCHNADCTTEDTAIRDQIIVGTTHDKIREEALKNSWEIQQLRKEEMRIESATKGMQELNHERQVNKMCKYSFKNLKKRLDIGKSRSCYYCGQAIKTSVVARLKS